MSLPNHIKRSSRTDRNRRSIMRLERSKAVIVKESRSLVRNKNAENRLQERTTSGCKAAKVSDSRRLDEKMLLFPGRRLA